jgi:hypothetical protein
MGFRPHDGSSGQYCYCDKDSCNYNFGGALSTEKGGLIILKTSLNWADDALMRRTIDDKTGHSRQSID